MNLVCVRTVTDILQMLFLHLKQAGLRGMIPDAQISLLEVQVPSPAFNICLYCGRITPEEIGHPGEVYTSQYTGTGESLWALSFDLVMQ